MKQMITIAVLVGSLAPGLAGCGGDDEPAGPPTFTALRTPELYVYNPLRPSILLMHVEGEDLDVTSESIVQISITNAEGAPAEAVLTHVLSVSDIAQGDNTFGIDLTEVPLPPGQYEVCASAEGVDAEPCAPVDIVEEEPSPCEMAFATAVAENPDFGCRCDSAQIKRTNADRPDGTLGSYAAAVGGPGLGPFDTGNVNTDATISSLAKFEPHFVVEIVNDPGFPEECTEEEWQTLAIGLCTEGQNLNKSLYLKMGEPDEVVLSTDRTTGDDIPYDPRPAAEMRRDGWGYVRPGVSASPHLMGKVKAHDAPNIVHWLDGPGIRGSNSAAWRDLLPVRKDHYFHSYVHGTSGMDADSCDCYFSVTSIVINADGSTGPSTISEPDCQ